MFCTDKDHPRRKHGFERKQGQRGVLPTIADRVRTVFRPYPIGDPRGRFFVRAKL
jgi:hypothetical protein